MVDKQDDYIQQHLHHAQIANTLRHSRYFLISIMVICLYIFCIYHLQYRPSNTYFNTWFILTELLVSMCWLVSTLYFKPEQYDLKGAHRWLQIQSLAVGSCIAVGIYTIYYYLPQANPAFEDIEALTLSALLLIVTQAFGLTYLTQKLSYFCLVFLPSLFPFLLSQIYHVSLSNPFFGLALNFAVIVILLCANSSYRIHRRTSRLYAENNLLVQNAEQQVLWSDELCQQLQTEVNKSKDIELQLQLNNQLLEQKVRERTYDIEQINHHLKNQQQNLQLAHEIAGIRPWDWNIQDRTITLTNHKDEKILRDSKDHHLQLEYLIHPDDLDYFKSNMKQHLRGRIERYDVTYRIQLSDGSWSWVHDIGRVIQRDPKNNKPLRMVGIRRDIQQERISQERLKLVASVLEQAAEGIFILNPELYYIDVNPHYEYLSGYDREQIIGKFLFDIAAQNKAEQRSSHASIIKQLQKIGSYDGEVQAKFLSGKQSTLWLHINAVTDDEGRITHYVGIVSDLTERKLQEQRLSYLENYDTLTDLPNRFYYNYQLHQYLVSQKDSIQQMAVIRLNIDRFRPLNEYLSNNGGDELLRQVAQRLRMTNAEALFVAHLNGDDFAIIYEISHIRPSVQHHCERIAQAFSAPFNIYGQDYVITLSMGVAFYPDHGRQLDYLNNCAEQALNEAKNLGGNTIHFYSSQNEGLQEQGIFLERDLRKAIQNNELIVYYQPKINFSDQSIYGFEALIRWNHPEKGIIPPGLFIPLAEQTSLISDIGRLVIQQTAKQIRQWNDLGFNHICVSVNIVAQQLRRGQLLDDLDQAIDDNQISGTSLELEITESSLIENSETVKNLLNEIKQRQIHIALDDFGTGYSSLSYLADFPIDTLKIDRSFVSKIGENKQEAIVSAMVAMGKAMGMTVVAEGIETIEQLEYLRDLDCDIAQGYLFSKPLPEQEATTYLKQNMVKDSYIYQV
ncbi:putative bifunctional diguanylate cyclase/phosphodiesterase [Acinetobacter pseudolwoffii]|uniref:putative bifunctional diguanylate cyclase/phosphodiesterase n=1 Tax=Acinetobacter pseudolwoffii TaxID=2053287 RepID=UPI002468CD56|nr:GGDEF domain-containing phosphodiesterase [Acinetobacter pseudolwoffii]MDH5819740.1 EAL domain-containing protein [Acinetobacter pseudolwoffii]MDM1322979.1 EAL domain-containing protein [Acinetobacter pseudolwoffii]MDM1340970.1 EAL domain-containing protein [Acinetobacter pseudolwoffii]